MSASPVQPPLAPSAARSGIGATDDGASEAASAFASLLAGMLPVPVPAAATVATPLGVDGPALDGGAGLPDAATAPPDRGCQPRAPAGQVSVLPTAPRFARPVPAGGQNPAAAPDVSREAGQLTTSALPSGIVPGRAPGSPIEQPQGEVRLPAPAGPPIPASVPQAGAEAAGRSAPVALVKPSRRSCARRWFAARYLARGATACQQRARRCACRPGPNATPG